VNGLTQPKANAHPTNDAGNDVFVHISAGSGPDLTLREARRSLRDRGGRRSSKSSADNCARELSDFLKLTPGNPAD